jgi:hypothetical protein
MPWNKILSASETKKHTKGTELVFMRISFVSWLRALVAVSFGNEEESGARKEIRK